MAFDLQNYLNNYVNTPEGQKWINTGLSLFSPQQPAGTQQQPNPLFNIPQQEMPQPPQINLSPEQTAQNVNAAQQTINQNAQNKKPLVTFDSNSGLPNRNDNMSGLFNQISGVPALTGQNFSDAKKLFDLKSAYALADKILADENLTDAQRNYWRGQQNNFADSAAMIRRSAVANGFNPDDYGLGSGNTLAQSTQALHYLQNRDMKNFLDLKSASEKASERYKELRAQGVEPYRANYLANQEMGANRQDVINQLSNALDTYGINSDGSYNSYGLQILRKMYNEDPELVSLYTSQLASPKEVYSTQNQLLNNLMTQAGANDRTAAQIAANYWGKQFDAINTWRNLLTSLGFDWEKFNLQLDETKRNNDRNYNLNVTKNEIDAFNAQWKAYQDQLKAWRESDEGQDYITRQTLVRMGYTEGTQDWLDNYRLLRSGGKIKPDEKAKELKNELGNMSSDLKRTFKTGDIDSVRQQIQDFKAALKDPEKGYMKKFDSFDLSAFYDLFDNYENYIDGKIGIFEFNNRNYALQHPGWKLDPDKDPEWFLEMSPAEREEFMKAYAKEKGLRSRQNEANETVQNYGKVPPSAFGDPNAIYRYQQKVPYNTYNWTGH